MTTYDVLPRDDNVDFQQSWKVIGGGKQTNHTTIQAARNKARERASVGDTIRLHRTDGTFQEEFTVRKASRSGAGREETVRIFSGFEFGLK